MSVLKNIIREMDFDYLGPGEHGMGLPGVRQALTNDHFLFLDVRTDQEAEYLQFPFAVRIPLHELPDRLEELPRDKCIVPFCSSIFRGAVAYSLLRSEGFDEVRCGTFGTEDLVTALKPGPLFNMK